MSYLLVADDFSEVSDGAVNYALEFAKQYNLSVVIIHSFTIPIAFGDTPMPAVPMDEAMSVAEERMSNLCSNLSTKYEGVSISGKVMFGDVIDCLEECAEKQTPLLIVVGNSGTEDNTILWGSNVLSALKDLQHPVLAVPPDAHYSRPENICLACDFTNITQFKSDRLLAIVQKMNAQLHVLNVAFQEENNTEIIQGENSIKELLSAAHPVYHHVEKDNVESGIHEFLKSNNIDWLIILPHHHSFFEGLFHKSHTKAIMKMTQIPLLAIHEK